MPRKKTPQGQAPVSAPGALVELVTTLAAGGADDQALRAALAIVMRELGVERGALYVRDEDGRLVARASHGLAGGTSPDDRAAFERLVPIRCRDRELGRIALGPRADGTEPAEAELRFLEHAAACAAAPIENRLVRDELRRLHQRLSVKSFELESLFELSRDLLGGSAEEAIQALVVTTAMGHFLVSRAALYLAGEQGLHLACSRGLREPEAALPADATRAALAGLGRAVTPAELPAGPLRRLLELGRLALAVPLVAGSEVAGVLAIGERASGLPFSDGDRQVAEALARHAQAALENARLQRVREAKLRQDRELQLAREIQRSLYPGREPAVPGFEVAGESRACYEVGGDCYDWIPLAAGRLALVIADVAGKGTPASLLMASVHAFLQALAGTAQPAQVMERLNRFLFANTQPSRFVTLFYAELDPAARRLVYVNAGHVPPYRVGRGGTLGRLDRGGPALGLIEEAGYETGELVLEPGDVLAMVTDGVTEAATPDDREFGDDGVSAVLARLQARTAPEVLRGLVAAVSEWTGASPLSDDLTASILKAT